MKLSAFVLSLITPFLGSHAIAGPEREITGVVDSMGVSGWNEQGEQGWSASFHLIAWREGNGPIQTHELRIEQKLASKEKLDALMEPRLSGKTVRLIIADNPVEFGQRLKAIMTRFVGIVPDTELEAIARPLLNPPPFEHPQLGIFKPDSRMVKIYRGKAQWLGVATELSLDSEGEGDLNERANTAIELLADATRWQAESEAMIADKLFETWRDSWAGENESLSKEQWLSRIRLDAIHIYDGGYFELEYSDGNLFAGHWVLVAGSLSEGVEDASLAG